jgi:hypothetical protein
MIGTMSWTIFARDPETGARGIVIEVRPELGGLTEAVRAMEAKQAAVATLCRRVFDRNMRMGMLVSSHEVVVVRDRLASMSFADSSYARYTIATARLFEAAGIGEPSAERLLDQVRSWLTVLTESWDTHLPPEAFKAFVPDVVGYLVRGDIEVHEGLLPLDSAAE